MDKMGRKLRWIYREVGVRYKEKMELVIRKR